MCGGVGAFSAGVRSKNMADNQGIGSRVLGGGERDRIFHGVISSCAACSGCDGDLAG